MAVTVTSSSTNSIDNNSRLFSVCVIVTQNRDYLSDCRSSYRRNGGAASSGVGAFVTDRYSGLPEATPLANHCNLAIIFFCLSFLSLCLFPHGLLRRGLISSIVDIVVESRPSTPGHLTPSISLSKCPVNMGNRSIVLLLMS